MNKGLINRSGQVTIFIIIGVIIIALAVLIYAFYPQIKSTLGFESKNPSEFIQSCLEDEIKNTVGELSLRGGSLEPDFYYLYNNEKVEYLCYTNEDYKTCVMQQPMLKEHIEEEIENQISGKATECFNSMKESYANRGYAVNLRTGKMKVELLPKKVVANFDYSMTLTKGSAENYEKFRVVLNNNLYELVSIATSILNWEAHYGDAETTTYMNYYHDLKVEKLKQSDGTKIYILSDRDSKDKFQFATRSVAWPAGFGG